MVFFFRHKWMDIFPVEKIMTFPICPESYTLLGLSPRFIPWNRWRSEIQKRSAASRINRESDRNPVAIIGFRFFQRNLFVSSEEPPGSRQIRIFDDWRTHFRAIFRDVKMQWSVKICLTNNLQAKTSNKKYRFQHERKKDWRVFSVASVERSGRCSWQKNVGLCPSRHKRGRKNSKI